MKYFANRARKFQEGGAVAPEAGANPMQQIIEGAMQAVQNGDGELALQVCQMLVELAQGQQGQGAPEGEPEGEPVYRKGGKLIRRTSI